MNSASHIALEVIFGARDAAEIDRERARRAAAAVCNEAGVQASDAAAAYRDQCSEFDDEGPMHGLALVWIAARNAAGVALTDGWANPHAASCSIDA